MNVYTPNDRITPATLPYGSCLEEQDKLLENVRRTISGMRPLTDKSCLELFQKGTYEQFFIFLKIY